MWGRRDNAPVPNTCPKIDQVKNFIDGLEWLEDEKDQEKEAQEASDMLEVIRDHNSQLREWGNQLQRDLYEIVGEREDLERQLEDLRQELKHANKTIETLEDELANAQE